MEDPILQAFHVEVPEELGKQFSAALEPHLPRINQLLEDCQKFLDHYRYLIETDQLHPENAIDLARRSDLLRWSLIEPHAMLESMAVVAEYSALQHSDMKTVELKRRQAEAWIQPFVRLQKLLREYASWLDRVGFTLREAMRRRE